VTATAGGKTYVTVGSHGFYYRQALGASPSHGQPKASAKWRNKAESKGDIATANVEDLAQSTASELVEQLNKRARISSFPAWALIAASVLPFLVAPALWQADSSASVVDGEGGIPPNLKGAVTSYVVDARGEKLTLASLTGQVLVLDFWKKDCAACPRQLILSNRVRSLFLPDNKVGFLKINSDSDPTLGRHPNRGIDVYFGRDLAGLLGISRVPAIVVLDQNGRENSRIIGIDSGFERTLRNSILSAKLSSRVPPPAEAEILASSAAVSVGEVAIPILSVSLFAGGFSLCIGSARNDAQQSSTNSILRKAAILQEFSKRLKSLQVLIAFGA